MKQLLKQKCAHSPLNLRILSSTSVPFTLTTVKVPNLALTHTKRITVWGRENRQCFLTVYTILLFGVSGLIFKWNNDNIRVYAAKSTYLLVTEDVFETGNELSSLRLRPAL
jgi:hypothetical protein